MTRAIESAVLTARLNELVAEVVRAPMTIEMWIERAREIDVRFAGGSRDSTTPIYVQGYDWREAFAHAGGDGYGAANVRQVVGETVSVEPFGRTDIAFIVGKAEGENDGANWVCFGKLYDGRWFSLSAGCDYTGWDCQASGTALVATTADSIVRLGLADDERERLQMVAGFERSAPGQYE